MNDLIISTIGLIFVLFFLNGFYCSSKVPMHLLMKIKRNLNSNL